MPTHEAQKKAEDVLRNEFNLTESQYKPKVILPKLKFVNLNTILTKATDELKESVIEKNCEVSTQLQANTDSELSVMFLDEIRKIAVIKATPDIREIIMRTEISFTSLESRFVYDHFHATQCFACQGYGHKQGSEHCTMNDNESICLYCAGNHHSKKCRYKQDQSKYKCANCVRSKILR